MRRLVALIVASVSLLSATNATAAEWHSQQPLTGGIRTDLGEIGDIEFWAPNRGVLITAGNGGVGAGIFAYDGTGWYRYSTVCGGHKGRIAWVGPDEFWTISDQQVGQATGGETPEHVSLCHFKDGQVIASYGEPVGLANSYLPMSAVACSGPNDCWFGGKRLPGLVNEGAFHLHWDGSSLTAIPSLTQSQPQMEDPGRSVKGLAFYGGQLFESVQAQSDDLVPNEGSEPTLLHQIDPALPSPFQPAPLAAPIDYGPGDAEHLEGFHFSSGDSSALWAVSGADEEPGQVTVLRKEGTEPFAQVPLVDPGGVFSYGDVVDGLAAEPGTESAWVAFRGEMEIELPYPARLARVHADGTVDSEVRLPAPGEGISEHGTAGPVACPAAEQCWMGTEHGWLFHLGTDLPQDTDPAMHTLITFRPADDSLPFVPPIDLPEDDSGASSPYEYRPAEEEASQSSEKRLPRPKPVYSGLRQKVIGGRVLELTFVLHEKAHVRLVAKSKGRVVARTPRYTMSVGHQSVRLRLDPKRWPTKLDFQVRAVKGSK